MSAESHPARTALGRARGRHRAYLVATCVALLVAAIGDEATGYDGPGPFIYPAFALLVALVPGRFTPLIATAMGAFFVIGGVASPVFVHRLLDPGHLGDFVAGWGQMAGFAVAAMCAVAAVVTARPSRQLSV
ncbi:hypothetical protein [Amycolatopsis sp. cmx-4-61]|uniref:hypothetical protein n=1 Tax=Amycolatopsis sp. cmx-4-61 TaxID=2790937 RepID=UPI00397C16D0